MNEKLVSRRGFIMGAATAATGMALMGTPLALAADGDPIPKMGDWAPYYTPLDPLKIGRAAFSDTAAEPFAKGCTGCGGRSAGAIIGALAAAGSVGWPWTTLPLNVGSFHNGGGPYGETCGGVMGPYYVMCLLGVGGTLGAQWHKWCSETAFPSTQWDEFSTFKNTVQTVSDSPLCHVSRTVWQNAYLKQWDRVSAFDSSRCGKLYADMTMKAVEMLNDWKAGVAIAPWAAAADYESCYSCHNTLYTENKVGASYPSGKDNCASCHDVTAKHAKGTGGGKPTRISKKVAPR
jgi:hypothetical protein